MFSKKSEKPFLNKRDQISYTDDSLDFYNYAEVILFDKNIILTFKQITPAGTVKQRKLVMSGIVAKVIAETFIEPLKDYKKFEGEIDKYNVDFYNTHDNDIQSLDETLLYIHDFEVAFSQIAFLLQFEQDTAFEDVYYEAFIVNPELAVYLKDILDDVVNQYEDNFGEIELD
ncbi:DUF3467 domain-containing protein [Macrococcus epidermidis]|uniref:DUF3467 domain-containing protein n=1 Tax=Macrococcus epidermidis TaxID=1902580 RepID=UPI0020B70DE5|nr:DUF3467 domain-containing protein [Macrococcus epidermidis]UTH17354.1 hypothetical protein KFV12_06220 [Macrococcus epidermidis]